MNLSNPHNSMPSSRKELGLEFHHLLSARDGHFLLESGYHGSLRFDLEPLFLRPLQLRPFVIELATRLDKYKPQAVCGPLVGGAFLAQMIAMELGIEFLFAERITKSPSAGLFPVEYRIPRALRAQIRNRTVAIVDDAISAGSAVRGTVDDLLACDARPVAIGALLVLGSSAVQFAKKHKVALEGVSYLDYSLWTPSDCPLCRGGTPVEMT